MREALVPGYRLSKAATSNKILISLALSAVALGLFSAIALTITRTGLTPSSISRYYRGEEAPPTLGDIPLGMGGRSVSELAEVTHLHLVGGSIMLFLLCHLIALCSIRAKTKIFIYSLTFGSYITTFAVPWLIVFVGAGWSIVFAVSIVAFLISLFVCIGIIFWEMWFLKNRDSTNIS